MFSSCQRRGSSVALAVQRRVSASAKCRASFATMAPSASSARFLEASKASMGGASSHAVLPMWVAGKPVYTGALDVEDKVQPGKSLATVACASSSDIVKAFAAAEAAEGATAAMPSHVRRRVLDRIASTIAERITPLSEALALEAGKPIRDARIEVGRAVDVFRLSGEEAVRRPQRGNFEYLDSTARSEGFSGITSYFPVGTISMIVPFNFPINLAAHKIGPAIAAGCPWVLKPSDRTPATSAMLGAIISEAAEGSLPEGAFSILPCRLEEAHHFSEDPRIKLLSFTGSTAVGWKLRAAAGSKKVTLELGGDAACIVDACLSEKELAHAADRISFGGFFQAGQSCISVQRVLVHASQYDALKAMLLERAAKLKYNKDLLDPKSELGPLIAEKEAKRVQSWVNEAAGAGAKILLGNDISGSFMSPTIVENVPSTCQLGQHEAFGPVLTLTPFGDANNKLAKDDLGDMQEAINKVNSSRYGLQTGVFTTSMKRAFLAFNKLHVGGVVINDIPSTRIDSQPYGGVKDSGLGREGVRFAIEDFTEPRVMLLKGFNP